MLEVGETKPDELDPKQDVEWDAKVTLRIGPHPGLSNAAKKAIELDYGMENGELTIEMRVKLSYYFERRLGLDIDATSMSPERLQIVLLNSDELEAARSAFISSY